MELDRGASSRSRFAVADSRCVVVLHFHHTQRVKGQDKKKPRTIRLTVEGNTG